MRKLTGVLVGFVAVIALCTFIVAQEPVDQPEEKPAGDVGTPAEVEEALRKAIETATEKLADLGEKKLSESDLDSVLKETLAATEALKKLLNQTKDPAMREIINQLIKELGNVREIVELTKKEYAWGDAYGCPGYNKRQVDESLRKIDEALKKLGGGGGSNQ